MKELQLRQIIREEAKSLLEGTSTPIKEFVTQSKSIDVTLGHINKWWTTNKVSLKKHLSKNPDSWMFLGRGAELNDVKKYLDDVWDSIKNIELG